MRVEPPRICCHFPHGYLVPNMAKAVKYMDSRSGYPFRAGTRSLSRPRRRARILRSAQNI